MTLHEPEQGRWYRFSDYVIVDGRIRPAPGARGEWYELWRLYREARDDWQVLPHFKLINLVASLRYEPGPTGRPVLTDASQEALLAYCREFGLLTSVLNRVLVVHLAPRWCEPDQLQAIIPGGEWPRLVPGVVQFARSAWGWRRLAGQGLAYNPSLELTAETAPGDLIDLEMLPETHSPGVYLRDLLDPATLRFEALTSAWHPYFPDVPATEAETAAYPRPLSDEFFAAYAEPVDQFISDAQLLWRLVATVSNVPTLTGCDEETHQRAVRAAGDLNEIIGSMAPIVSYRQMGERYEAVTNHSLLEALARMAVNDILHKRVLACPVCKRWFVSEAYQATYCSTRCRNTAQKRALRAAAKSKRGGA